jgi:hypothetical protein
MSTPEFWYENDDTLLLEPDKSVREETPLFSDSNDQIKADMDVDHSDTTNGPANTKKQPTFKSVEFDSDTLLIIYDVNDSFKDRQKFQLSKQYKIDNIDNMNNITGPITLDLLYTLKKYTTNPKIVDDIDNKIDEIINEFRSSCNIVGVATRGDNKMSKWRENTSSKGLDIAGASEIMAKMRETAKLIPYAPTYLLNPDGSEDKPAGSVMAGQMHTPTGSDNDDAEMSDTSPRISDEERLDKERLEKARLEKAREQGAVQIKRTRSTDSKGGRSTRKRKPSKIPHRTIRRRASKRGQKRTIRRRQRNKKGTQKRRK